MLFQTLLTVLTSRNIGGIHMDVLLSINIGDMLPLSHRDRRQCIQMNIKTKKKKMNEITNMKTPKNLLKHTTHNPSSIMYNMMRSHL